MRTRSLETLSLFVTLTLAAACPAGDGKDAKDAKDTKAKTAAKDGKDAKKPDAKKPDAKKPDAKQPDAKQPDVVEPPATPATGEEIGKFYQACWTAFGTDWDAFGKCYAEGATSVDSMGTQTGRDAIVAYSKAMTAAFTEPVGTLQLTLVNGNNVVGIARIGGKHTGPMVSPAGEVPATNKTYGMLMGHVVALDENGRAVTKEWAFMDSGSMMGQLGLNPGPHRPIVDKDWPTIATVVAKNDETETKNVESHKAFITAFNAKDLKAVADALADDLVWSEAAAPADMDKKQFVKDLPSMYKGFSDLAITNDTTWGAGDYVVSTGTWTGTNDGDIKAMKLKKTGKKVSVPFVEVTQYKDGKIASNWIFYDGMQFAVQLGLVPAPGAAPAGDAPAGDAPAGDDATGKKPAPTGSKKGD